MRVFFVVVLYIHLNFSLPLTGIKERERERIYLLFFLINKMFLKHTHNKIHYQNNMDYIKIKKHLYYIEKKLLYKKKRIKQ